MTSRHLFVYFWAFFALLFALCPANAQNLLDPSLIAPPETKNIPVRQSQSPLDVEELDLTDKKTKPSAYDCSERLPTGGVVGLWKGTNGCPSKQWARSQYATAQNINAQLWCADLGNIKSSLRTEALARQSTHQAQLAVRSAFNKQEASAIKNGELKALSPKDAKKPPSLPYYDPSKELALSWDARESAACSNGPLNHQLGPSISAYATGQVTIAKGKCDALLVEANFLTGRHAMSRITWVSSKCSEFKEPDPSEMALAISNGTQATQAWQDQQLEKWNWEGAPARSARVRSADGR